MMAKVPKNLEPVREDNPYISSMQRNTAYYIHCDDLYLFTNGEIRFYTSAPLFHRIPSGTFFDSCKEHYAILIKRGWFKYELRVAQEQLENPKLYDITVLTKAQKLWYHSKVHKLVIAKEFPISRLV